MSVDASAPIAHGNYVASSQPGCHIAHHTADWIIEASAFEAEDYGLEPGEEEGVPDIIVDPETRSLRYAYDHACILVVVRTGRRLAYANALCIGVDDDDVDVVRPAQG